jgi:hypothetical protein
MGVIVHGRCHYAFSYLPNIKHGTNVIIEALHHVLLHQKLFGELPRNLYVQLDNTSKQNKNKFLIGWLACLVQWGLFDSIFISFLPVGHTHEDIDQMFSCIARALRKTDCLDRQAILSTYKAAYHINKQNQMLQGKYVDVDADGEGRNLKSAANISDWLLTYLADFKQTSRRVGLAFYHQFHLSKEANQTILRVRQWCGDDTVNWTGLDPELPFHQVHIHKNTYTHKHTLHTYTQIHIFSERQRVHLYDVLGVERRSSFCSRLAIRARCSNG